MAVQAKSDGSAPRSEAERVHEAAAHGTSGPSGALPYLDEIQRSFGEHDVRHVKAHTDGQAAAGARAMGAEAFTVGEHVAFAGAPSLHTAAHEAAHVVQQRAGVQLKGGVGEAGDAYEQQHADAVADAVVQGKSSEALLEPYAGTVRPQPDAHRGSGHELQRQQRGSVRHTSGAQVDTYLQTSPFIQTYVAARFQAGTRADGHVHIDTPAQFLQAFLAYAATRTNPDTGATFTDAEARAWEPNVNAFRDGSEIHVHQDRGETGTAIHESIHLFSSDAYRSRVGFHANEGTTEYFARMICAEHNIIRGAFYTSERQAIDRLVVATSREHVAAAYFQGQVDALRTAVDTAKGAGTFTRWIGFMNAGNYAAANALL